MDLPTYFGKFANNQILKNNLPFGHTWLMLCLMLLGDTIVFVFFLQQNSIPDEVTENVDFFTDMTPSVSRQARVYVGPKTAPTNRLGVLEATDDLEASFLRRPFPASLQWPFPWSFSFFSKQLPGNLNCRWLDLTYSSHNYKRFTIVNVKSLQL